MEIKNLKKAAERITTAVKNKENIILYGDADLDGAASVIIFKEALKNLGAEPSAVYFPDRETEGYGITPKGLDYLKKFSPALLVAFDLGIGNFEEVKTAKKLGLEVIIIDHHEILDKLPSASIIVNPKQKGDKWPFKEFAASGLSFKLAELILAEKFSDSLRNNFLELAALATIADMMPKKDENALIISEGKESLERSWRPAVKLIFSADYFRDFPTVGEKISRFIFILNVRDVKNGLPASFRLLESRSLDEAGEILKELIKKTEDRRQKIKEVVAEVENNLFLKSGSIIFEGSADWDYILISAAASILCKKYKKPTFIFKKLDKESQGTVRTPEEVNSVLMMKKCKKLLLTFGGHPQASGFRLKNENLEKFKECLIKNYKGV